MHPRLFLDLARDLAKSGGPAQCRSCVSRAYYAVYHAAAQFLERMQIRQLRTDYHIKLQQRLLNSSDDECARLGSDLGDLHQARIDADYHLDQSDSEAPLAAEAAIGEADRMIASFDNCAIYSNRWKQIQASIMQHGPHA
jgi:hypothetical protein